MAQNIVKENFEGRGICGNFALATVTNYNATCGLKTHHYKLMPGSTVVALVTVASFLLTIAPGSLVSPPSVYQNLRHMLTNSHAERYDRLMEQLRRSENYLLFLQGKIHINPLQQPEKQPKRLVIQFTPAKKKEVANG